MEKQTALKQLELIASSSGKTVREIKSMVMQVFIDDENFSKRILEAKNHQIQEMQLNLMKVQLHNSAMQEILLEAKLKRRVWWHTKREQFTKIFKRDGRKEGKQ